VVIVLAVVALVVVVADLKLGGGSRARGRGAQLAAVVRTWWSPIAAVAVVVRGG
jgi:hypothetical protein